MRYLSFFRLKSALGGIETKEVWEASIVLSLLKSALGGIETRIDYLGLGGPYYR